MDLNFEDFYTSLDADARHIYQILALSPTSIDIVTFSKVVNFRKNIPDIRIREVLEDGKSRHFIVSDYYKSYLLSGYYVVWLYPLIEDYREEKNMLVAHRHHRYYGHSNAYLVAYLEALWRQPEQLNGCGKNILLSPSQVDHLLAMFTQPRYDKVFDRISAGIAEYLCRKKAKDITYYLNPIDILHQLGAKLSVEKTPAMLVEYAQLALIEGNWEQAHNLVKDMDSPISLYAEASVYFVGGDEVQALDLFEKGLKKQRREYKQSYIPTIPETALFYLIALLMGEPKSYLPVLGRIIDPKTKNFTTIDLVFSDLCRYLMLNNAEVYSGRFKSFGPNEGMIAKLWKIIALGITGEHPYDPVKYMPEALQLVKRAFANGYLSAAYEAAYALKNMESEEAADIYSQLWKKLKYKPALSRIKRVEEWEKQLNTYLSLDAVKALVRQETEAGKMRIGYRFYPEQGFAQPVLQTRQADGGWSTGRNISMINFTSCRTNGMTEQDQRIANTANRFSYNLDKRAIAEMTGHPHVFLADSEVPVELVKSRPVLNVVDSAKGGYMLESDITDMRGDVHIEKETNTRYKVYQISKQQREIIEAVKKGRKIPEAGREKLMKVLEHFSAYLTVQTDLQIGSSDTQTRQVEPDSRIRVQLLPLGEGLKAEIFVKPFGAHPPYCKPGKGGKLLLANQEGERLQVLRNLELEVQHADRLLAGIQTIKNFDMNDGMMTFEEPLDALELLDILRQYNDISVVEWPEGERMKVRHSAGFENLSMRVKSGVNWFELDGKLKIDEQTVLTIAQLLELVRQGHGRFVELTDGEFIALSEQFKRRLTELSALSNINKKTATINRFATASISDSFDDFANLKADKAWRDFRKKLREAKEIDSAVPAVLQAELRPYQEEGYRWMIRLATWGAGACLADDMGLGKTLQSIAVLLQRASIGPALVVSPVSVQPNWISEINRFAPSLTVKTLLNGNRAETLSSLGAGDLLVISYGLLQSEEEAVTAIEWATVALDEAHVIKNYNTKTSKAAMSLRAEFRIILTGTPLQNHLGEMWNLFQFINPGLLGTLQYFSDHFIKSTDDTARSRLKKLITPFILRRTKTAVLDELPPKTEIIRKIELSVEEAAFYEALRRRAIENIEKDDSAQGTRHLKALAEITRLRQACCSPRLVEPKIDVGSTKLATFMEIAAELKENGHRALVFSQFVTHLAIVREELDQQGFSYQYLDGSTPTAKREEAVKNFQEGKGDLFLISLKAGGLGLNLTAADFVIHLDPWWNPAIEDQASDRAHRIGQSRPVTVYRLVARHTIEEKIIQLHNTKRDLADSLLEGSDQSAKLSMDELMALMKSEN
jgi:hypothetical protein